MHWLVAYSGIQVTGRLCIANQDCTKVQQSPPLMMYSSHTKIRAICVARLRHTHVYTYYVDLHYYDFYFD